MRITSRSYTAGFSITEILVTTLILAAVIGGAYMKMNSAKGRKHLQKDVSKLFNDLMIARAKAMEIDRVTFIHFKGDTSELNSYQIYKGGEDFSSMKLITHLDTCASSDTDCAIHPLATFQAGIKIVAPDGVTANEDMGWGIWFDPDGTIHASTAIGMTGNCNLMLGNCNESDETNPQGPGVCSGISITPGNITMEKRCSCPAASTMCAAN